MPRFRLKQGVGWRFTCRDVFAIFVFCLIVAFAGYDKNFIEALGPQKAFDGVDRVVTVKVVVDPSFVVNRSRSEWENEISMTTLGASKIFERDFGIRLVECDLDVWEDNEPIADIKRFSRVISSSPCDIAVLFTRRELAEDGMTAGIAAFYGDVILLRSQTSANVLVQQLVLVHELAHLFLASHTDDKGFFMSADIGWFGPKWDELNWRIIILNKYRNFHKYDFLPF